MNDAPRTEAVFEAILARLATAPKPSLPPVPLARVAALVLLVASFHLGAIVLLPLFSLVLLAANAMLRLVWEIDLPSPVPSLCFVAAIACLVGYVRAFLVRRKERQPSIAFARERDAQLFKLLDAVASCAGTAPVDRVVIRPRVSFGVRERRRGRLELELNDRDLCDLSLAEFASIMLHEFAHFGEGHTRRTRWVYRRVRYLVELDRELGEDAWHWLNPIWLGLQAFWRIVGPLYAALKRQQELQADALAVHVLGAEAFANGLRKAVRQGVITAAAEADLVEAAIEAKDLDRDVIAQIAAMQLSDEQAAALEHRCAEAYEAPAERLDHHPSVVERIEHAERIASGSSDLDGVAAEISGGTPAYDVLFSLSRAELHQTVSRDVIRAVVASRGRQIGLRGPIAVADQKPGEMPTVFVRGSTVVGFIITLITCLGGIPLLALIALMVVATKTEAPGLIPTVLVFEAGLFLWLFLAIRGFRGGLRASGECLTLHGLLGTSRLEWRDVTALRYNDTKLDVRGTRADGKRLRAKARGSSSEVRRLADAILERAPRLACLAWGTGMARVSESDMRTAELPSRVYETWDDNIVIVGPDASRIVVDSDRDDFERIKAYVEMRLLPMLMRRE